MRMKHLLLATTASAILGIAAGGANAADVIMPDDVVPIDRVDTAHAAPSTSVCDAVGAGYFYIPGTETCLKIGGKVEAGVLHSRLGSLNDTYVGIDAHVDFKTSTASDFGNIGSVARLGLRQPIGSSVDGEIGLELAYLTVGGGYLGYKESLFNREYGYGNVFDLDNFSRSNSLTFGYLAEDLGGGVYAGIAVEDVNRGRYFARVDSDDRPDVVGRLGMAGQPWGSADLSAVYGTENGNWTVKGVADINVLSATQARLTAAYSDDDFGNVMFFGVGGQHTFNEQVKGYAGLGYAKADVDQSQISFPTSGFTVFGATDDIYIANAGLNYAIAEGFDVNGEVVYARVGDENNYGGMLRFTRSW